MKVLQINSVFGSGSTGRIVADIHNLLTDQDYESYVAYGRGKSNYDEALQIGNSFDNYTHVALTRIFDKHGFGSKEATQKFIEKVKFFNPDVIHLHNIHGYYINIEILFNFLNKINIPIVWTLHDCWAFTGHCAYFDYVGCQRWKKGCFSCPEKKSYPASYVKDNSKNNYFNKKKYFTSLSNLTIVTPSKWLKKLVNQSFLSDYPVKTINNGIDLETFKPTASDFRQKFNLEDKFIILGVAGVWDRRKGYQYFIDLAKKIDEDDVIVLVGLSEEQKNKLPKNIIGFTKTENVKQLVDIYSTADVFINPTLEDNFPTTNLEALACGTPVITFRTGGSVESVNEGTGYIVEVGNTEKLLNAINEVKENTSESYSNSCIKRAELFYEKNDRFKEYIKLYKDLIK